MEFGLKRLAITGGVAEGKSTVLGYLREAGLPVVSADDIARQVWAERETQQALQKLIGPCGTVTREEARHWIASAPEKRRALNNATHPRILRAMLEHPAQIVEVPLLVEACLFPLFQRVWVVTCGPECQIERLTSRLGDADAAHRLVKAQLAAEVKTAFADRIVRTNQDEPSVRAYVLEAVSRDFG